MTMNGQAMVTMAPKDAPGGEAADLGPLPEWNLADLYSGPDGADLAADFAAAEAAIAAFEAHRGKVAELSPAAFGAAIKRYEWVSEVLGQIGSYAQLHQSG